MIKTCIAEALVRKNVLHDTEEALYIDCKVRCKGADPFWL